MNSSLINSRLAYENLSHVAYLAQLNRDGDCARAQQAWLLAWLQLSVQTVFNRQRAVQPAVPASSTAARARCQ